MSISKHLAEAISQLELASIRIEAASSSALDVAAIREWLSALTAYVHALADIQTYQNESVHEKLQLLARRAGVTWSAPMLEP